MNKIFATILYLASFALATPTWESQHAFLLKKDEWGKVLVYEKAHPKRGRYEFRFRWTLYDGKNVIVQSRYRDFPKQHNLTFDRQLNSFRQILLNDKFKNTQKKTYLLLSLDEFVKKEKKMQFFIFISDKERRLEIKYIDPKSKAKSQ